MLSHIDLSDNAFEVQFETCALDPSLFTHEAHLRLAWIHITKYGLSQARKNVESQIQRFVTHVGAQYKYHHTLTVSAIYAVHHFIRKSNTGTFPEFIIENPELLENFKGLINSHYSYNIFASEEAKEGYIEPDLVPFE